MLTTLHIAVLHKAEYYRGVIIYFNIGYVVFKKTYKTIEEARIMVDRSYAALGKSLKY